RSCRTWRVRRCGRRGRADRGSRRPGAGGGARRLVVAGAGCRYGVGACWWNLRCLPLTGLLGAPGVGWGHLFSWSWRLASVLEGSGESECVPEFGELVPGQDLDEVAEGALVAGRQQLVDEGHDGEPG